ncbi:major facilitator superfamily transporter [Xylariomycetidae sp. FL2044]|nr:major facilitator superfamily transporter [Xylariomycetidae sp. FL2044]
MTETVDVAEREEKTPASSTRDNAAVSTTGEVKADGEHQQQQQAAHGKAPEMTMSMSTTRRRVVMFSLCLALFLSALDITIVATALPTIAHTLGATAAEYAWVGSSYTLASTSSTPIWAKLSDIFGRKAVLMVANAVFMAGSLVSALARSPSMLIGGRIAQGLGSGGSMVLVTIIIGDMFALKDRAKYYGYIGLVWAVASSVGPILGGIFTQTIGWQWCFWINLPFDGASIIVLFFALDVPWPHVSLVEGLRSLDWIGCITVVGGTIMFLYGLETGSGGSHAWDSPMVLCLIIFGILLLSVFFLYEARYAKNPLIPSRIFGSTTNVAAFMTTCLHSFVFITYDYFLPLYFQVVLGFAPIISGVTLFALVIPLSVATFAGGYYVRKTGNFLPPLWIGGAVMTLGTGLYIDLGPTTNWAKIIIFQIIAGLGAGPMFQVPMIALQSHVRPEDVAMANSALTFARNLFTSTSIVIGTVLLQRTLGGASLATQSDTGEANRTKYVSALRIMWIFYTAVCGVLIIMTLLVKKKNLLEKNRDLATSDSEKGEETGFKGQGPMELAQEPAKS